MMHWFGGLALILLCLVLGLGGPAGESGWPFLLAYTAMCLIYGALYWKRRGILERGHSQQELVAIVVIGVCARVFIFPMPHSDDVHRYLWEGRLQQLGGNPYEIAPKDAESWVPFPLRPDLHRTEVNHPELTTVYPPGAQVLFLLMAEVRYSAGAWKIIMILSELAFVGVLIRFLHTRGQPRARVWRYFWHPLPMVAFAGEGHLDILLLLGTWVFFSGLARPRPAVAAVGLSLAILTKFLGGLYAPIAFRRLGWKGTVLAVVLVLAFTLPFVDAGFGLVRTLVLFGREMSYNTSWQALIAPLVGEAAVRVIGLAALAVVGYLVVIRDRNPVRSGFFLTAAFLLVSPTIHPWYLTWLVPFLVFRWRMWAAIWSCTVGWAYIAYSIEADSGQFRLPYLWLVAEYLPVYLAFGWWAIRGRDRLRAKGTDVRTA